MRGHRLDVGWRHVAGHRLDTGPGAAQTPPEGRQSRGALARAHEDHGPRQQVQHDGEILMALGDSDLINGDLTQIAQPDATTPAAQMSLEDVLHGVPADLEMTGEIQEGHGLGEVHDVPLKGASMAALGLGET